MSLPPAPSLERFASIVRCAARARVTGRVASVTGPTIHVRGMSAPVGAVCCVYPHSGRPARAQVIGFQGDMPILAPLDPLSGLASGDRVELVSTGLTVPVGGRLAGRILDGLGRPIDGRPLPPGTPRVSVDSPAPSPVGRPPIREILGTGIRAIDGLLTCGRGQRLGIFAGSGVGKSTLLGMLARGCNADAIVIGLVGERGREVNEFIQEALGPEGLARSTLVVATSDQPATLRVQAAWTATAIAESLRDEGRNVLLLVDSVTRLALAQREIGLAAGEPPTTRGYPPSVFAELPRLVERTGRTEAGTITAFYSVLVEGDDLNEPVADTLRGLLDGHVVLSRRLAEADHWPAIDVLASLSRLQPQLADAPTRAAASRVRAAMAEYLRHEDLISIGAYRAGTNPTVDAAIALRDPIRHFLTQSPADHSPLAETLTALAALAPTS